MLTEVVAWYLQWWLGGCWLLLFLTVETKLWCVAFKRAAVGYLYANSQTKVWSVIKHHVVKTLPDHLISFFHPLPMTWPIESSAMLPATGQLLLRWWMMMDWCSWQWRFKLPSIHKEYTGDITWHICAYICRIHSPTINLNFRKHFIITTVSSGPSAFKGTAEQLLCICLSCNTRWL